MQVHLRNGRNNCVSCRTTSLVRGRPLDNHNGDNGPSCPQAWVLGRRERADMTDVNNRVNFILCTLGETEGPLRAPLYTHRPP